MADDKQKNADFIGHVIGDAKNPQETRMLTGWFGEAGDEGYRRLYADAELSSYLDIPDDAILHSEPLKDVQPSGGVIVWIKRDAALKPGGSAASRAARFLQGQVQQDFASAGAAGSLEKAGLRCVTEVPCGEPTGFTGQCTKQPEVGGAWPCITAIPHCFEVTGFTGKCTHAPWPNPTRYIGCTQIHCPTHDLTHIPHICNIVASGNPGCVVVDPPQGGDPARKVGAAADAEARPLPATEIPGCGYTRSWGVCETHLLGCGYTKDWGNQCPTQMPDCPTAAPGCGWSRNPICTDLPGCNWTKQPAICQQTVSQGMVPCTGPLPIDNVAAQRFAAFGVAANVPNAARIQPGDPVGTLFIQCNPSAIDACPSQRGCQTQPVPECPSAIDGCPTRINCNTQAPTAFCTQFPEACQTNCGPQCQTQQLNCTQFACTQAGPQCPPPPTGGIACTAVAPCPVPTPQLDCTFTQTQLGPICPGVTNLGGCPVPVTDPVAAQAFAAPRPAPLSQVGCPPSDFVACSQFGGCPTLPKGDCTFFGCPSLQQQFAAGPGGGCTQSGPQCPTHAKPQCTFAGPACPPTPATVCTQFAPCPTHQKPCHTPGFECTMFCTQGAPGCPHSIQVAACPITLSGPQCPAHSGFHCPSAIGCQSIACQSIACQQGGGGEQALGGPQTLATVCTQVGPQCPHTHGCPTPGIDCTVFCTHAGPHCPPTPATVCTQTGPQCHTQGHPICPTGGVDCTVVVCTHVGPLCPPNTHPPHCPPPTPLCLTVAGPHCPPHTIHGPACPVLTAGGPHCPPASGFNCPSVAGCQSIACGQSIACQQGGGGQQEAFAARAIGGGPFQPTPTTHCFVCDPQPAAAIPHTQLIVQCHPSLIDACPTRLCTHQLIQCHPSLIGACPTQHFIQCNPSAIDACPTRIGCPTQNPAQCPPHSGFNCPSQLGCQSIACGQSVACVSAACQPGGGGQQQAFGAPNTFINCVQPHPTQLPGCHTLIDCIHHRPTLLPPCHTFIACFTPWCPPTPGPICF